MNRILISGAGMAGLCLARQLKKHDIAYTIIDKKPASESSGTGIALPANAVRALRYMGLSDAADTMHQVRRIIYSHPNGRVISEASLLNAPLNRDKFVALERTALLATLQQGIEKDIHFNVVITGIQQTDTGVNVTCSNPALNGHYQAVIGADGVFSTVRELGFGQPGLIDLGVTNWRWICEFPTQNLQPTYMLGLNNIFMAYPIGPNRIYCYTHQTDIENRYYNYYEAQQNLRRLFASYQGVARPILECLPDNEHIYTGRLRSVPFPIFNQGHMALIGDAGNACSPMLQQGAALAFEDAIVLSELLAHFPIRKALEHYRSLRQQRVTWVVKTSDNSIKAFIKMNSRWSMIMRNMMIKRKGPLNVQGWKYLLSQCPLDQVTDFIQTSTEKNE
ncbi:FAD-dependent monooxygenase [Legionella spiritensis]|uniref:Oxidoreductase n=1 Tax=Legionella spiritensis TaxID=452 RepID=A0A0W0Z5Z3_LEGSP|nr:FAD-dependent monooxygenase [Legionella spiritensis]KTD64318.1 oxidoreductase [Legionella spiritensis]SNV46630.1 oxidoreductase [Legionella spiritensis]